MRTVTTITTPSSDQIEDAWFNLMQGELGIDQIRTRELAQAMIDYCRSQIITNSDGEPVKHISSHDMSHRVAAAFAALLA